MTTIPTSTAPTGARASLRRALAALTLAATPWSAIGAAAPAQAIDMVAARWEANGALAFSTQDGFPRGLMTVKGPGAILKDVLFTNGTIEYDINEDGDEDETSGIWFHQRDRATAEYVYLRPAPDCPGSVECIQYGPVVQDHVQWDVYPEYQASAPVRQHGWNHVKLVISGKRMNVFINREATPSLQVGHLESDSPSGQIQLRGNATYANVVVTPDAVEGLAPAPSIDPTAADARYVRHWQLSPASTIAIDTELGLADMLEATALAATTPWEPIAAERKGFVNLSRSHGTPRGAPDLVWLKTTITSERAQTKQVALGFARQVWIFANGAPVYTGKNFYYPAAARTTPLARMTLDNGTFALPLVAGKNEVVMAISNDLRSRGHYGWGFAMRLADIDGLALPGVKPAM
jgi:hypothetical protein